MTVGDYGVMVGGHAYTVTGNYMDASGQYVIELYNPWAQDGYYSVDGSDDGLVYVSPVDGYYDFSAMQITYG